MPDIPEEAVQAATEALKAIDDAPDAHPTLADFQRHVAEMAVEAAAPVLAAQIRRETAEQIAGAIAGGHKPPQAYWRAWAARIAREIGEARG